MSGLDGDDRRLAQRVLVALSGAAGAHAVASGAHAFLTVGGAGRPVRFSDRVAERLVEAGLLRVESDGRLTAAEPAAAWIRRQERAEDPYRAQHQTRRQTSDRDGGGPVVVDDGESPLAWLARRNDGSGRPLIDAAQFAAGERLRADFTRAQMMPRVTANWDPAGSRPGRRNGGAGGMAEMTEAAIAAKARVDKALKAVGPELSGVLIDVCCFLKGIAEVERERGWPARSAKVILQLALTRLARHYGIAAEARGRNRAPMRAWGGDDFRPAA